jgi:hypothetical protein
MMYAILGEIVIARYMKRQDDGRWMVRSPQAGCKHILHDNLYTSQEDVEEVIRHLVPEPCRPHIRFVG